MSTIEVRSRDGTTRTICPVCHARSIFNIYQMHTQKASTSAIYLLSCGACGVSSFWKLVSRQDNYHYDLKLVDPISPTTPRPEQGMPPDVLKDYEEARLVEANSPRAAAALLRLALQKLCKHLGEPGQHLDTDIRSLAKRPEFGERLIKAADTLRIAGNNSVHPGEMNDADIDNIAIGLFDLLNLIVRAGITEPKKWDAMYTALPEEARTKAEKKDGRQ